MLIFALTFGVIRLLFFVFSLCVLLDCRILFIYLFAEMDSNDFRSVEGYKPNLDTFGSGSNLGPVSVFGEPGFGYSIFLYMKCLDERINLGKINPFKLAKSVDGICGNVCQVKPLRNGQLLIEVKDKSQADKLLKCKTFVDDQYEVVVSLADKLNCSKGVIYAEELLDVGVGVILENFKQFGVSGVRRLNKGPDRSPTALLVFRGL